MFLTFYKYFCFICLLLTSRVLVNESQTCDPDETHKLSYQQCLRNAENFEVAPLPQCPENFVDAVNICYIITPPSTFPPQCPFENVLPFETYKDIIFTNGSPIWMPVRRDISNGLGFLEWKEASNYKVEFPDNFDIPGKIKGNDCLVYYNNTRSVLVSCEEEFSGVCAYYKLNELTHQTCQHLEMCYQKDFNDNANCVCVGGSDKNQSNYIKAEFLKPYQNHVYGSLTSDDCTMGLERISEGTYVWTNSQEVLDYSYWKSDVDFSNTYGALTPTGWTLTAEPLPCFLYETNPFPFPVPTLNLTFEDTYLLITITNIRGLKSTFDGAPLVFCFTNAGSLDLTYRYEYKYMTEVLTTDDISVYQFEPQKKGPGHYWCEAFTYFDPKPIKSDTIFVNETGRYGNDYVTIFNTTYVSGSNILSSGQIVLLDIIFVYKIKEMIMNALGCSYSSRVIRIIDIDEENFVATIEVHFTYLKPQTESASTTCTDEEYDRMKTMINETVVDLKELNFAMLDFRSASYCLEDFQDLQWPRTNIGEVATVEDYCFQSNGMRLQYRRCEGNFIGGAHWAKVENCTKPNHSSITNDLLKIDQDQQYVVDDLYNISFRYPEFNSFDLYLMAILLYKFKDQISTIEIVGILENFFKVDGKTLAEAQERMRATDMILEIMDDIISKRQNDSISNLNSDNFSIIIGVDSTGIVLLKNRSIQTLTCDCDASYVLEMYPNLEAAVWITSTPGSQNKRKYPSIFKLFNKNSIFIDPSTERSAHFVFGVTPPSAVQLLYKNDPNTNEEDCVYWAYNLTSPEGRGFWKTANKSENLGSFVLCDFVDVHVTAVTLLISETISQNVTESLEKLLESDEDPGSVLNKLSDFSDRYDEFSSNDVYLVGRILDKISDDSELDLSALAHVVSNMHEIQRKILSSSQKEKMATDLILHAVDVILSNHNFTSTVNVIKDNFMIYVANVKETDFTALVVFENSRNLQTEIFTGTIGLEDLFNVENLNGALYLPFVLKQQLMDSTRIIVTLFFNDGLFNEDTNFKFISKVFGVILPLDDFLQPLSFIYKVSPKQYNRNCVHWLYDKSNNITGLWKKDNDGNSVSVYSQCEFWHTTHFALLLVDTDRYNSLLLDWITNISCFLSMFGLGAIVVTAVLFKRWRTNRGNQILLNYVFASILQISVFYTSSVIHQNTNDHFLCTIFGVILHYSIISQFCWMFVIAVLQFQRFVEVLRGPPQHIILKACLCGWGLPCLPVACVYFLDQDNYIKGNVSLCYPSGLGLFLGVWLPIGIVVVINFVIFIFIIYNVVHKRTECGDVGHNEAMFQWRLAILLFFMLGITWTFGFLSELNFGIVFVYVFCVTATLQGFVMFMFFIVFNVNTRYLYVHACKKANNYY